MGRSAEDFPERVSSWADLSALVEHVSYFNGHAWLFRGVPDAGYGLVPKIGRDDTRAEKQGTRTPYRLEDERALFTMFVQQARPHVPRYPNHDLEWLAVAQHHGLPTRLLDWTESLLVAAWFAVLPGGGRPQDSAIWVACGIPSIAADFRGDPFSLAEPCCYRPPHISPRIAAQSSVFVLCPRPTEELKPAFVRKVVIAPSVQFTLKKRINACGINSRQLFPDLAGLSEHLEWMYKHDWLAGYRQDRTLPPGPPDDSGLEEGD